MLTELAVKKAQPRERDYKVADSGGLSLFVRMSGHKSWRYKYRFAGKERRIVFGPYPEVSLKKARELRDEARATLRAGRDPGLATRRARLTRRAGHEDTFERFAREWHQIQKPRWKPVHAEDVLTSMVRDLFPVLGDFPIGDIDEPLLLSALRPVEQRGAIETAHRLRQRADRVFRYAAGVGASNRNPAVNVAESLSPALPKRRWPALTDLADIRNLLRDVDRAAASPVTRLASRFLALTAQRPGMVRLAEWSDFEGIDWAEGAGLSPEALWRIPAARMKLELELREDDAFDHIVPLAPAAVEVLRTVRRLSGKAPLVFPGGRGSHQPLSENAVGYLYNREGWKGRHVPHGWRASFSTVMNGLAERMYPGADRLVIDRLVIDLMLAHVPIGMSATEARYNRAAYVERRRELAESWADLILDGAAACGSLLEGPRRPRR